MDVIAEEKLLARFPDGRKAPVRLRIGRPRPHPRGDWACEVDAEGLHGWQGPRDTFGVGSWQSLMHGIGILRCLILLEIDRGVAFHWLGSKDAIDVEMLFWRPAADPR